MASYKRLAPNLDTTFRGPRHLCFACCDTGILSNADGLLRDYLPDYDCRPDGTPTAGHDLALVCWCSSAYPEHDGDGKVIRSGFRESSGDLRQVITATGKQPIGTSLSKELTRELHTIRKARWEQTEQAMSDARSTGEVPWFIAESKAALQRLAEVAQTPSSGLQSLGDMLGTEDPFAGH